MKRLVIIGGGISGLAAAWAARRATSEVAITLLERDARPGGKIRTDSVDGFLLEQGPDSFLSRKLAGVRLAKELGIDGRLLARTPRSVPAFVMRAHALHPLPQGFSGMVPTDLRALSESTILSEAGKRRALQEPSIQAYPADAEPSVAQFMRGRFGGEAFDLLIEPLVSGIYAADADQLSLAATFPQLRALEQRHGSLTAALRDRRPGDATEGPGPAAPTATRQGADPSPFLSFPDGMEEIVRALVRRLDGVQVRYGAAAASVSRRGGILNVVTADRTLEADALILATPAHEAAGLCREIAPTLSSSLAEIPFSSSAVIHLAYRRADVGHPLDGYGYLIPAVEGSLVLGCTWSSRKWSGRAPEGTVLLRMHVGRFSRADVCGMPDADLVRICRDELAATLGLIASPILQSVHRWEKAMPQYTREHPRRLAAMERALASCPGLFLAGSSYRGIGVPDCIDSGEVAADAALRFLDKGGMVHD